MDNISFHHNQLFLDLISELGVIVVHLPHYCPTANLVEYMFRDIKAIEKSKNIYGEREGLISLIESVEKIKNKDYSSTLQNIGYIK